MSSIQPNSATVTAPAKAFVPKPSFDIWELNDTLYNKDRKPAVPTQTSQSESKTLSTGSDSAASKKALDAQEVVVLRSSSLSQDNTFIIIGVGVAIAALVVMAVTKAPSSPLQTK